MDPSPTRQREDGPPEDVRAVLVDAPPSAKLVYFVLDRRGPATQGDIAGESLLPPRTVRSALDELEASGLVSEERYVPDARKKVYSTVDEVHE